MNPPDRALLESLDELLRSDYVRVEIDKVVQRVARQLAEDHSALMSWEPVPLAIFGQRLPRSIESSWVFILRAGATTGAERHPNSHQRMMSYQGTGNLQTGGNGNWLSHDLTADQHEPLERRWISIPKNVWHQAVVPADGEWVVVSFHTVPAAELIEERPDAVQANAMRQRRYVAS